MATAQLIRPPAALPREAGAGAARAAAAPSALGGALLALLLFAAFDHGAGSAAAEAWLQAAVAVVTAIAAGAWVWSGTVRFAAPRLALLGIGLLAAFALWSGLSLFWSVAPDQTWLEVNRAMTYVLATCLAVALGASHARSLELIAEGFLVVVMAVTVYALGQKLFPGLHVPGLFNLNQTGPLARLQEPFGYWNALGLFVAMGVPIALMLALDRMRTRRLRLSALASIQLMVLTIAFTYSRGALLALVVALIVGVALSRATLRSLMWLASALLAATPPLIFGLTSHSLTASDVKLGDREAAGALLALIVVVCVAALLAGGLRLLALEWRVRLSAERTRLIRRGLLAGAACAVVIALVVVSLSGRGLGGTVSHAWHSFTTTKATSISDPHRLLSADSENRWVWWKEAAGAFSDRPLAGWGAGSFRVVHLLYRRDLLTVDQPHSVPLQWLAETGIVGGLLGAGAIVLLLIPTLRAVRGRPQSSERLLAVALFAGVVAYVVHSFYDWDWDIPGLTLPALVLLGVLSGSLGFLRRRPTQVQSPGPGARGLALGGLAVVLCAFVASAVLPSVAASKASAAEVLADNGSAAALDRAAASAGLAARLDPISDAGPLAQATIANRRFGSRAARKYLLEAVRRQPTDHLAWQDLMQNYFAMGDGAGAERVAQRVAALDPVYSFQFLGLAALATLQGTPPRQSATAIPVP